METINQSLTEKEFFVKLLTKGWAAQIIRANELLESLTDEELSKEIAPGRNRGIYLLGHLVAVHDNIIPLLGFGKKHYPQLEHLFISSPDKSGLELPPIADLRKYWKEVNEDLTQHFNRLQPEEWLKRHEAISEEDFAKEPHRNKLNVLINRTAHLSYHLGQLVLLREKTS